MTAGNTRKSPLIRTIARPIQRSANSSSRIIRYQFSDDSVGRDGHRILGWDTRNYGTNPVFQWAHDRTLPPIGKVLDDLEAEGGSLRGSVQYATRDEHPLADTVYQLVRGGYLNAVSTSWLPIDGKWKYSTDRSRPGGIDFEKAELLELSQVPVPALPGAVATARAAGVNTAPLAAWAERALDERNSAVSQSSLMALRAAVGVKKLFRSRTTPQQRRIAALRKKATLLLDNVDRIERERRRAELGTPQKRRLHAKAVKKRCAKYLVGAGGSAR